MVPKILDEIEKIRPLTMKRLLLFYYKTYVVIENRLMSINVRNPRIRPGLKAAMEYLQCNRTTAMDYLKGIDIIRKFFVEPEIEAVKEKQHKRISPNEFGHLRSVIQKHIIKAIKASGLNNEEIRKKLNLREADKNLQDAIKLISESEKFFSSNDVVTIFQEFIRTIRGF